MKIETVLCNKAFIIYPSDDPCGDLERIVKELQVDGENDALWKTLIGIRNGFNNKTKQLERLASKYQSHETQRLIEIGRATESFFKQIAYRRTMSIESGGFGVVIANNIEQLLDWATHEGKAGEGKG